MSNVLSRMLTAFSGDPIPGAPPTPLVRSSTPTGAMQSRQGGGSMLPRLTPVSTINSQGEIIPMRITAKHIEQCIDEVESDPTAGLGLFTKRQILVDKLMRTFNTAEPSEVAAAGKVAAALMTAPRQVAPAAAAPNANRAPTPPIARTEARTNLSIAGRGEASATAKADGES